MAARNAIPSGWKRTSSYSIERWGMSIARVRVCGEVKWQLWIGKKLIVLATLDEALALAHADHLEKAA